MSAAIEKLSRILATTVPAFLPRENPISRNHPHAVDAEGDREIGVLLVGKRGQLASVTERQRGNQEQAGEPGAAQKQEPLSATEPSGEHGTRHRTSSIGIRGGILRFVHASVFGRVSKDHRRGFSTRSIAGATALEDAGSADVQPASPPASIPRNERVFDLRANRAGRSLDTWTRPPAPEAPTVSASDR
jgi:hypothetical protein